MPGPTARGPARNPSEIALVDVASGKVFPPAPTGSVLQSSVPLRWHGIVVERHRLEPRELPEHTVVGHGLSVSTSTIPISFGWKDGGRWRDGVLNPGEFHLLPHGQHNTPRWLQRFDEVSLVLDPEFVAGIVEEGLPAERIEFATRHSASDATIARYTDAFCAELATGSPGGSLHADTLAIGFALHLLSNHAVARPKVPSPRGKLNAFQLRSVLDYIEAHLGEELPLLALARQANVSAFHFARQFRSTVGLPPHQFVLRQRVEKSVRLLEAGRLPLAQVAVESGFYDQPHLTRAFRKVLGTTPARYSARR